MEEEIEVEYVTGETVKVKLRSLSHKVKKRLNKMIAPDKVNSVNPGGMDIDYDKLMNYNEEVVKSAIVSPESLKTSVEDLTEAGFMKLLEVANSLNEVSEKEKRNLP